MHFQKFGTSDHFEVPRVYGFGSGTPLGKDAFTISIKVGRSIASEGIFSQYIVGVAVVVSAIGWAGVSESEAWDGNCTCMIARYSNRLDGDLVLAPHQNTKIIDYYIIIILLSS